MEARAWKCNKGHKRDAKRQSKILPRRTLADGRSNAEISVEVLRKRERVRETLEKAATRDDNEVGDIFQPGEAVWLYDHVRAAKLDKKFEPYWSGPYIVLEDPSRHLRLLKNERGREQLAHVDSLQPYKSTERTELINQGTTKLHRQEGGQCQHREACWDV